MNYTNSTLIMVSVYLSSGFYLFSYSLCIWIANDNKKLSEFIDEAINIINKILNDCYYLLKTKANHLKEYFRCRINLLKGIPTRLAM